MTVVLGEQPYFYSKTALLVLFQEPLVQVHFPVEILDFVTCTGQFRKPDVSVAVRQAFHQSLGYANGDSLVSLSVKSSDGHSIDLANLRGVFALATKPSTGG